MNESPLTKINRALVEYFADLFYAKKNVPEAFMKYVEEDYIQHNPGGAVVDIFRIKEKKMWSIGVCCRLYQRTMLILIRCFDKL